MFNVPNEHLTENERASLVEMMSAVERAPNLKERYNILEGKSNTSYGAGRAALSEWWKKKKIADEVYARIDAVWEKFGLAPVQLIHEFPNEGFPDVHDADPAREDIALAIFGDNALQTTLRGEFRESLGPIIHHNWERHRKVFKRAVKSVEGLREKAADACKSIEEEKSRVTPAMLRTATVAVKKYSTGCKWFPTDVAQGQALAEMEEFLKHVVVTAVAKAKGVPKEKLAPDIANAADTSAKVRGRARARKVKNLSLSAAGDVDLIWPAYVQLFQTIPPEPEPPTDQADQETRDAVWDSSNDLGVDEFKNLNDVALNHLLQFPDGRPALFAEFRSKTRKCSWDNDASKDFVKSNSDMVPLSLLWHQRVGVAAIVDKIWQPAVSPPAVDVPGILIADEVGVGKTALVMGTIAFTIDAYWVEQIALGNAKDLPVGLDATTVRKAPILEKKPFFAGNARIPNLPHIVIVPNSLLGQWSSELRIFFAARKIEIYQYPTAEKEFARFWTGPWETSKMPFINRVILVTHSVFTTQGKAFDLRKGKSGHNSRKASDEKRHLKGERFEKLCMWYKRNFASCTLDEAHDFRNLTGGWYAILEVMKASSLRLISTATPLWTSPKDLCNIGRLLRMPYFVGKSGDEHEELHWKQLRAARRGISKEDTELAASYTIQRLAGSKDEYDEPESKARVRQVTSSWIANIRSGFAGRVIRRTVDSLRFDGKKINDSLPPYKMMIVPVNLTDDELQVHENGMKSLAGDSKLRDLDDPNLFNTTFYLESRTKVAFPFHNSPHYPPVNTFEEYDKVRSTKVDYLMTILRWHLISDDHGVYRDLDKQVTEEEQQIQEDEYDEATDPDIVGEYAISRPVPDLMHRGKRKILVFMEFPMMAPLLVSILKMHDIDALVLNGTLTPDERNEVIHKFNTDPTKRVLLFSTVGAVGLNLTVANIVVLHDQCWSRMLVNQIIGRAWRLGQEVAVFVYNMVAVGTVDVLMVDHGEGKGKMLGQFLEKNHAIVNRLQRAMRGDNMQAGDDEDDDDDDEIEIQDGPPATSRSRGSTSTAPSAGGSSRTSGSAATRQSVSSASRQSASSTKATNKKVVKIYGGKKTRARNIDMTGDDEGDIFDTSTI
ncbi:hypothetical protein BDR04DRAFT_1164116, partial [Suillus decipiens]